VASPSKLGMLNARSKSYEMPRKTLGALFEAESPRTKEGQRATAAPPVDMSAPVLAHLVLDNRLHAV